MKTIRPFVLSRTVLLAATTCGISGLLLSPVLSGYVTARSPQVQASESRAVALSLEGVFMRVAETVGPATVSLTVLPEDRPISSGRTSSNDDEDEEMLSVPSRNRITRGSGVIVRSDGYIVTNDHIVEDAPGGRVTVTLSDQTTYSGRVFRDSRTDLAVIKITPEKPLPFVRLADSRNVKVGQWAVAIGSPFGQQNTVTTGIVSALHRNRDISDGGVPRRYTGLIQTDASINPGNSGGPLLNIDGELIGVNVAIYSPSGASAGIGYAIPVNTARRVMDELIARGKVTRTVLGVRLDDVPAGLRTRLKTRKGAYISEVHPDMPAETAGIAPDDVIVRFGSRDIDDEDALREAIASTNPNATVPVTVWRNGKEQLFSTKLKEENDPDPVTLSAPVAVRRTPAALGFRTGSPTKPVAAWLKRTQSTGVFVTEVQRGGLAHAGRLFGNSVIYALNGVPVTSGKALQEALSTVKSGDTITLLTYRWDTSEKSEELDKPIRAAVLINIP